jgi:hypothetical protein
MKVLGKFLFIGRQARANQIPVSERKAKLLHFFFGFFRGPALLGHTVRRNHHCRAIVTQTAMNENLFAWILPQQRKKFREYFIFWKRTLPG